jgi:hypothetical protein
MKFISETEIETVASSIEDNEELFESLIEEMEASQPILLGYCFSENTLAYTRPEQSLLLYLTIVIWKATQQAHETIPVVTEEQISLQEEKNWETFHSSKAKDFRDRLNPFFEGYFQEDLLAFVEDALVEGEEEEDVVTVEGRPALFVSLKTVIDTLTSAAN